MTTEQLAQAIYDAHAAPYGEYLTPALAQQLRISARNAALTIHATMQAERISAERARREHVRELAKLPLRERIRTHVRDEAAG